MTRPLLLVSGLVLGTATALGFVFGGSAPPEPASTPLEAWQRTTAGLAELDLTPVWDGLPPSWQADLEAVVLELRQSARPELWARGLALLEGTATLLEERAELVNGSERLAQITGAAEGSAPEAWRARALAVLVTLLESGLDDPDKLEYLDLRELAGGFLPEVEANLQALLGHASDRLLAPELTAALTRAAAGDLPERHRGLELQIARLGPAVGLDPGKPRVEVDELEVAAELTFVVPGAVGEPALLVREVRFVEVEGRWLDASFASSFHRQLARIEGWVALWSEGASSGEADYAEELLDGLEHGLAGLAAAETVAEFDGALDEAVSNLGALALAQRLGRMLGR